MCGIADFVHNYNYAELPPMQPVVRIDFSIKGTIETASCKTCFFPLLEDVFKEFPKTLINVEIKVFSYYFSRFVEIKIIHWCLN
jgi:hypothetical protein